MGNVVQPVATVSVGNGSEYFSQIGPEVSISAEIGSAHFCSGFGISFWRTNLTCFLAGDSLHCVGEPLLWASVVGGPKVYGEINGAESAALFP